MKGHWADGIRMVVIAKPLLLQEDAKRQITDLQYDLLELRDAHAKLRTTNEKLRRDQERAHRERDDLRGLVSASSLL